MTPVIYSNRNEDFFPSFFNDLFDNSWMRTKFQGTTPAINVSESDTEYTVEIAAPGMTKEDFNVSVNSDGDMVISMEKSEDKKSGERDKKYLRREFSYSKFEQRLTLPDNVERQRISARMTNGILTVDIPKKTEEEKAQETQCIEIR